MGYFSYFQRYFGQAGGLGYNPSAHPCSDRSKAPAAVGRAGIELGRCQAESLAAQVPSDRALAGQDLAGQDYFADICELCKALHGAGALAAPARLQR